MNARRQIIDDRLYAHFITFSVYRRRRLLDHDHPKQILLGVLNEELRQHEGRCVGFVVMPDHVHAIVWFPVKGCLSRFMAMCIRTGTGARRKKGTTWLLKNAPEVGGDKDSGLFLGGRSPL